MIVTKFFYSKNGLCRGFSVRGHAGSAKYGYDLVCCAVSSVVQMCCNGLTEVIHCSVELNCSDGFVEVWINDKIKVADVQILLKTLEFELNLLSQQHKKSLKFLKLEV